jgi:hypothetical protein
VRPFAAAAAWTRRRTASTAAAVGTNAPEVPCAPMARAVRSAPLIIPAATTRVSTSWGRRMTAPPAATRANGRDVRQRCLHLDLHRLQVELQRYLRRHEHRPNDTPLRPPLRYLTGASALTCIGETNCGGAYVNPKTADRNAAPCGNTCPSAELWENGQCPSLYLISEAKWIGRA